VRFDIAVPLSFSVGGIVAEVATVIIYTLDGPMVVDGWMQVMMSWTYVVALVLNYAC